MEIKKSQATNVFPSQSIEDYMVNGPSKTEKSDDKYFVDQDTRFVLDFMDVKRKYNKLREEGKTHGAAWRESQAYILPMERQILMKQEIEEKNPNFYKESKKEIVIMSENAAKKLVKKSNKNNFDFNYSVNELKEIEISQNKENEKLVSALIGSGFSREEIEDMI